MNKNKKIVVVLLILVALVFAALAMAIFFQEQNNFISKKLGFIESDNNNLDENASLEEKGNPSKSYREYITAIHEKDVSAFKSYLLKDQDNGNSNIPDSEKVDQTIKYLQEVRPTNEKLQIVNEIIEGKRAFLRTQIKTSDPNKREYGLIKMQKDQTWKVLHDHWESPVAIESQIDDDPNDRVEYWNVFTFCNKVTKKECLRRRDDFITETNHAGYIPPCYSCIAGRELNLEMCNDLKPSWEELCKFDIAELTGNARLCEEELEGFGRLCEKIIENRKFIPSFNPYIVDSDKDGLSDALEIKYHTDLMKKDTDGDGYEDGEEVENFYDPWKKN